LKDGHWSPVNVSRRPPARHRGTMAFDERRGISVLFGGLGVGNDLLGDTWIYARRRWHHRRAWWGESPEPRCGPALAYDGEARQVVLFGGVGGPDRPLGDTWTFDGSSWREVRGPHPPARRYAAFAYDPGLQGCVLQGGTVDDLSVHKFGDAWLFRGRAWERMSLGFETEGRDDHALAYHHSAKTLVLLEGLGFPRIVLTGLPGGWRPARCELLHPRHQCSPLAWDSGLDGLVLHGGEMHHRGFQFEDTRVLRLATGPEGRG
jgi:hypothetical protein